MAEIEMPVSVREALLARASTLDPGDLQVLQLAAIAGDQLDLAVLARASGAGHAAIEAAVRSGLRLQLLAEHRDGPRTAYAFRHALTREAMADELVGPDRQRAHRRVAEAIAALHASALDAVAAQLADHYEASGEMVEAIDFGLRAARSAASGYALEEAGRRYENVLRLMPATSGERLGVLVEAAEALLGGPDRRLSESFASEARDVARNKGDPLAEGRALSVLQRHVWDSGDTPGALALMREAHELVRGRDDRVEALVTARLARLLCLADRKEESAELVARGLEFANSTENARAASLLHGTRMMLAFFGPEFEEALHAAVHAARAAGDERAEENVASGAGYVGLWCGDFALAKEWLLRAMELATRLSPNDRYAAAGYAWLLSLVGDYPAALEVAQSVGPSARVPAQIVALTARYEVTEKTDLEGAGAIVGELVLLASRTGEAQRAVPALSARARHTLLTGGIEIAAPHFWEALERTTTSRRSGSHWAFSPDMARGLLDAGALEELTRWSDALVELTEHDTHPHNRAAQLLVEGYLDAARDDVGAARKEFEEAAALYRAMPCPAREAECILGLADLEWRADDPDASGRAARRAAVLADQLGASHVARRAMDAARRADTPPVLATVLVTDIVRSTERLADVGDRAWSTILERHHAIVRRELARFKGREIDTAGDGFLATFDTPAQGIRCALMLRDALKASGIEVRAGLHTGECQIMGDKVLGLAVHLAARVNAAAEPGEVLVSRTVRDLVAGSGFSFLDRGAHALKGVSGEWALFAVS
jgi:class 3 adenylate cyclase